MANEPSTKVAPPAAVAAASIVAEAVKAPVAPPPAKAPGTGPVATEAKPVVITKKVETSAAPPRLSRILGELKPSELDPENKGLDRTGPTPDTTRYNDNTKRSKKGGSLPVLLESKPELLEAPKEEKVVEPPAEEVVPPVVEEVVPPIVEPTAEEIAANERDSDIDEIVREQVDENPHIKPKSGEQIKKLAAQVKEERNRAEALAKEKADLEKKLTDVKPVTPELDEEIKVLRDRLAKYDVQELPEIVNGFDKPITDKTKALFDILQNPVVIEALKKNGKVDEASIKRIMDGSLSLNRATVKQVIDIVKANEPGNVVLDDIMDDLNSTSRDIEKLAQGKATKVEELKVSHGKTFEERQAKQKVIVDGQIKERNEYIDGEIEKHAKTLGKITEILPGDTDTIKAQKKANNDYINSLWGDFNQRMAPQTPKDLAKVAVEATLARHYKNEITKKDARIKDLEGRLSKANGVKTTPSVNSPAMPKLAGPTKVTPEAPKGRVLISSTGRSSFLNDAFSDIASKLPAS